VGVGGSGGRGKGGGWFTKIYSGHYSIKCDEAVSFLPRTQDRQSAVKLCISGGISTCQGRRDTVPVKYSVHCK
jgi:hypothetical protein